MARGTVFFCGRRLSRALHPFARWAALSGCLLALGCGGDEQKPTAGSAQQAEAPPGEKLSEQPHVSVRDEGHESEPVLTMVDGANGEKEERWIPAEQALAEGATLVDFSDEWTPYLFEEQRDDQGKLLPNRYRRVFIGLANDQLDGEGDPLEPGQKNYLELYGIFPSFSVLRARFLEDETRTCDDPEGVAALLAVKSVAFPSLAVQRRDAARQPKIGRELESARLQAKVATLAELAEKKPALATKIKEYERWLNGTKAVAAAERRLICEGFLKPPDPNNKSKSKHQPGMQDPPFATAIRHFQQKHMIYEGHSLRPRTLQALARPTLANDHDALLRALRERVIAAADVLEDGSAETKNGPPTYLNQAGERVAMRNLAEEYTAAAAEQLAIDTPERALAFFKRRDQKNPFGRLRAAVKLAPRPEYYSQHMELSIVIDRGDVWYEPPFDDKDKWRWPPRQRYPTLTLYTDYQGQKLPLVRWRTTIGGWRAEQASNGYEYYKYKGSDVGPRVMRKIASGPVWIAPETEPIRSLVKGKKVNGRWQSGVNYDALGPGYLSAYGVVAGYFVIPGQGDAPDVDRGIRAHGSSDYLSMYSANGYSHGCHRLPNHLAIRLYDFILQHRHTIVKGDAPMDFARQFLYQDHVYEMRIPSRGFEFYLDPPIAVNVLEGNIRGTIKQPVEGLVPKPGVRYPPTVVPPVEEEEVDTVTTATQPARAAVDKGAP